MLKVKTTTMLRKSNFFCRSCFVRQFLRKFNAWTNYLYRRQSKMSSSKKWPVKWLCGICLSEFIDWRYSQSCWYFWPSFVNCCSSNIFSGSTLLPSPFTCVNKYTIVAGGSPGRNLPTWILINLRISVYSQPPSCSLFSHDIKRARLYTHTVYTVRKWGEVWVSGPQTDKHLLQSPFTGQFF